MLMPKTIKAEKKLWRGQSLWRILGMVIVIMLSVNIGTVFIGSMFLLIGFVVFNLVMYVVFTAKVSPETKKQNWRGLLDWIVYIIVDQKFLGIVGSSFKETEMEMRSREENLNDDAKEEANNK